MADKIEITINGLSVKAEKGMTILEAALRKGIYIPHLCHHRELEPVGACRLCQVEIDGKWKKTVIACKTQVKDGMIVRTETPEINEIRQIAVELLIADHDTDCLACAQDTRCALQRVADHVGRGDDLAQAVAAAEVDGGALLDRAHAALESTGQIALELLAVGPGIQWTRVW